MIQQFTHNKMEKILTVSLELANCCSKEELLSSSVSLIHQEALDKTQKQGQGHLTQKAKRQRSYYWEPHQNRKYVDFLRTNRQSFSLSYQQKKKIKLNVLMSKAVKTRSPTQCHTHHQKMMSRFGSVQAIILSLFPDEPIVLLPSKLEIVSPKVECLDLLELTQQQIGGLEILGSSIEDYLQVLQEEHQNMRWLDGFID